MLQLSRQHYTPAQWRQAHLENLVNLLLEIEAQDPVRLVQDQVLQLPQREPLRAAIQVSLQQEDFCNAAVPLCLSGGP